MRRPLEGRARHLRARPKRSSDERLLDRSRLAGATGRRRSVRLVVGGWTEPAMNVGGEAACEPRRRTVLVAEDNADFRALLGVELREAGYEVVELSDGTQLLEYVS